MARGAQAGDGSRRRVQEKLRGTKSTREVRIYEPDGDVAIDFLESQLLVQILCGPLGSAKTIALLHKIHILMQEAHPSPDGKRRSRWVIVRNTYSDLVTTTMAKWREWWPENEYGRIKLEKPPMLKWEHGDIDAEIWFLALDSADDVKKLRSLEPSGVAFNELQFIPRDLFDEATSRVGRYPADVPKQLRQKFVLADMNAPDEGHWTAVTLGMVPPPENMSAAEIKLLVKPDGWGIFIQPPAVIERYESDGKSHAGFEVNVGQVEGIEPAENLRYLGASYYQDMLPGKTLDWVRNRLMVKVGSVMNGAAVWPMFEVGAHIADDPLAFNPEEPLLVAMDFGRQPAAVFAQAFNGRIYVLAELVRSGMSTELFAPILKEFINKWFPLHKQVSMWGDPAGEAKGQASEQTPISVLRAHGLICRAAKTPGQNQNDISIRLDTVVKVLNERVARGRGRLVIDGARCPTLKGAMLGGYRYVMKRNSDQEKPEPDKNRFSHIADALQYLLVGLGEGRGLLQGSITMPPVIQTAQHRKTNVVAMAGVRQFARRG